MAMLRYLFANVRPWSTSAADFDPMDPPDISQEMELRVVDLHTLRVLPEKYSGHKGYTPNSACFFIFSDGSQDFLASGSEDKKARLWSRRFSVCLGELGHTNVVNSVAFNPVLPELLATASDDHSIKIWRSKRLVSEMREKAELMSTEFPSQLHFIPDKDQRLYTFQFRAHELCS